MSSVWPILHYKDTETALRYLVDVLGFDEIVTGRDETGQLVHVELSWPEGPIPFESQALKQTR
ncbi:hypothetical protein [Mycobacteroides abscessus]